VARLWQGQTALQSDYWQTAEGSRCRYHASSTLNATYLQHAKNIATLTCHQALKGNLARLLLQDYIGRLPLQQDYCNPRPAQFPPGLALSQY
jgi:hypothetical protein